MRWLAALLFWLPLPVACRGPARRRNSPDQIREAGLDSERCYRVRDLDFAKEDVRFYFTDGYLTFGKPVDGRRYSAVFMAEVEAGDAEILVFPPSRSERLSLARATGSPNLNEHFKLAAMLFTDDTYEVLSKQIREAGEPRKSPERGVLLAEAWNSGGPQSHSSFETRLVHDLFSSRGPSAGFFYAADCGGALREFRPGLRPTRTRADRHRRGRPPRQASPISTSGPVLNPARFERGCVLFPPKNTG